MGLLFDSFWRAAAYCLLPRVMLLSLLPLMLMGALAVGLGYFYWDVAVATLESGLENSSWLAPLWRWLEAWGGDHVARTLAPVVLVAIMTPLLVMVCLLVVATMMTPALVRVVAQRRFPVLERRQGGSMVAGLVWSLGSTLLALAALIASIPLWLIPPLVLILPPLIWGWLTYRVMAFDVLAEHATKQERVQLMQRHRAALLGMGVLTGYLGAAPTVVWASGVVFAAAFFVLVPLAIWIYTLVFAFSSLWFAHFCLMALQQLRQQAAPGSSSSSEAAMTERREVIPEAAEFPAGQSTLLSSPPQP